MPIKKSRLNRKEETNYRLRLQQLQAEGHDFEVPEEPEIAIELGQPGENQLLDLGIIGGVGYYAIRLCLIAQRSDVRLQDYEITADCDDQVDLVEVELREHRPILGLFGIEAEKVLNSRLESPLRFSRRGQVIEGWLVAAGSRPIPEEYCNGAMVPFKLAFWDQFGNEIGAQAILGVHRLKPKTVPTQLGTGLDSPVENRESPRVSVSAASRLRPWHAHSGKEGLDGWGKAKPK